MPNINALSGHVRLLKSDERLLNQSVTLIDFLVQNFGEVFPDGKETEGIEAALEQAREPLATIAAEVAKRLAPKKKADA